MPDEKPVAANAQQGDAGAPAGQDWGESWTPEYQTGNQLFSGEEDALAFLEDTGHGKGVQADGSGKGGESGFPVEDNFSDLPDLDDGFEEVAKAEIPASEQTVFDAQMTPIASVAPGADESFPTEGVRAGFLGRLKDKVSAWRTGLTQMPRRSLYIGGGILVCLLVLISTVLVLRRHRAEPPPQVAEQTNQVSSPAQKEETAAQEKKGPDGQVSQVVPAAPKEQTWQFRSFLIPVGKQNNDKGAFLSVDVAMKVSSVADEQFSAERRRAIRDLIYQFFLNLPPYEVKEYATARGDLEKRLRAWIEKQWGEGRVEKIIFERFAVT